MYGCWVVTTIRFEAGSSISLAMSELKSAPQRRMSVRPKSFSVFMQERSVVWFQHQMRPTSQCFSRSCLTFLFVSSVNSAGISATSSILPESRSGFIEFLKPLQRSAEIVYE